MSDIKCCCIKLFWLGFLKLRYPDIQTNSAVERSFNFFERGQTEHVNEAILVGSQYVIVVELTWFELYPAEK